LALSSLKQDLQPISSNTIVQQWALYHRDSTWLSGPHRSQCSDSSFWGTDFHRPTSLTPETGLHPVLLFLGQETVTSLPGFWASTLR
jgi:hypothetical protein